MTLPDQRGTTERGNVVGSEPSIGELGRRIDRMDQNNSQHFGKIFERLDGLDDRFVTRRDFEKLEAKMTWIGRAVITTLLFPVVVLIVGYLLLGHTGS